MVYPIIFPASKYLEMVSILSDYRTRRDVLNDTKINPRS